MLAAHTCFPPSLTVMLELDNWFPKGSFPESTEHPMQQLFTALQFFSRFVVDKLAGLSFGYVFMFDFSSI